MRRSVGGAAQRIASAGLGSSPNVAIKETRKPVLRKMLAARDRQIFYLTRMWMACGYKTQHPKVSELDAERKAIRQAIKKRGTA